MSEHSKIEISTDGKKHVLQQIVVFKKDDTGWYIFLAVRGFMSTIAGTLFEDHLPLGRCSEDDLERTVSMFTQCNHNLEFTRRPPVTLTHASEMCKLGTDEECKHLRRILGKRWGCNNAAEAALFEQGVHRSCPGHKIKRKN